jgi:glutamate formiminotransferase/formiminotetrahydrofolate cyclodeaminase
MLWAMNERLIECVPNFSEGRNPATIEAIADAIRTVPDVHLLSVDPGAGTNRTVYTFVGSPEAVVEAAFQAARTGISLIDMARHAGEHPRFGALDVCPLVPVRGVAMEECVELARALGRRLGEELGLTIYLYEKAATRENRRNLADVRSGEYEGLAAKLGDPDWAPDFGPAEFNPASGATAVGARDFLIAYNVNLNTTSTRHANAVAFDVREKGRPLTENGKPVLGEDGVPIWKPGRLKAVKAIGWFIEEYGLAQVSMNLTDISVTPLHVAFDAVCESAQNRGMRVTGSELVGLVPLRAMLDAGRYFLRKQKRSTGVSDDELVKIAVKTLGLDELGPFDSRQRIIEYAIEDRRRRLVDLSVRRFVEATASESPAPGGGSVAATMGALGAALATMVANLSSHKRGWDDRWEEFSDWAERGKALHDELLRLIDEDTDAFNSIMAAFALPKGSEEEKRARSAAIQTATRRAIEVPLRVMRAAYATFEVAAAMAELGNPNSVSDAGVGALAARAAVRGALLNVRINAAGYTDRDWLASVLDEAARIEAASAEAEAAILAKVDAVIEAS